VSPVAERRLVSVLFADLVGFTPFAEQRDAEDVRETLTRYFDLASEVIARYGGSVEKFIGDAVMAVWGAPVTREDDAERAVRAGLELVDSVRSLGPGIEARCGILTGEAAVTLGATNQGMVAGDLVNTAARLQAIAPSGAVLVGESTQRAASRSVIFEPAGEQTLKGKSSPVPAWRAIRVDAERGGRGRSDVLEAPFVGRADELRLLKDLYHATVREGRTRLISIMGPAGIGKSRLAWELEKYLDGIVGTAWWHRGRSPAYGSGLTFWALGEMVRQRAGLAEADDERTTRAKTGLLLDGLTLSEPDRRWIEPALLTLLGIESGVGPEQLFGAWRMFFERLAATGPVILVFEDLHWADSGTLDFIDQLLEWSRSIPLYLVTLARPELLERRPDWGAGRRNFTSLYLEPLPQPTMRELLAGLVPGLPERAISSIVARADGVPLYAVETVRMLIADGKLTENGGTYKPVGDLASIAVSATLTALIAARLDGLSPADRAVVLDAAVLGQSFAPAALAAVARLDEATLEPRLRALVRRDLLSHDADPRSPGRGQYAFVQGLIREVAYNTLARADRHARHLAAADYFETLGSDELAGAIANHCLAAREHAPDGPERDALAARARFALQAAAERAGGLGAHDQAVAFLEQALPITTDTADRAAILEQAGEEASTAGHHDTAERHLRDAMQLRRHVGNLSAIAATTAILGRVLNNDFRTTAALALLEPAAAELAPIAGDTSAIAVGSQLARAHFIAGDQRHAIEVADRVLEAAEHADLRGVIADTLVTKGMALGLLDRTTEGIALIRAGQELAEAIGLSHTILRALNNRAAVESDADPRRGFEFAVAGIDVARRLGNRHISAMLLNIAGNNAFRIGNWTWALDRLDAALAGEFEATDRLSPVANALTLRTWRGEPVDGLLDEVTRLVGAADVTRQSDLPWCLGVIALAEGRLVDARAALRRCVEVAPGEARWVLPLAARAALWGRDLAGARDDLALLDAEHANAATNRADRLVTRAGIAALEGRTADALALYRDALKAWRAMGLDWDEALAGIDMATLLEVADPEVAAAAERSREILVRLQAKPFIERLEAAMARRTEQNSKR
jgi:class 3 adenylate cyclase/tetratricopeptide (TPR) repeat protein